MLFSCPCVSPQFPRHQKHEGVKHQVSVLQPADVTSEVQNHAHSEMQPNAMFIEFYLLFLIANIVTTSKALVTTSAAPVTSQ